MHRPLRVVRARALALPRPEVAVRADWLVAGLAVLVILAGLLAS